MTFDIIGEITIDVGISIEAENEDEARDKAVDYMIANYLTLEPTGVDAVVDDIIPTGD